MNDEMIISFSIFAIIVGICFFISRKPSDAPASIEIESHTPMPPEPPIVSCEKSEPPANHSDATNHAAPANDLLDDDDYREWLLNWHKQYNLTTLYSRNAMPTYQLEKMVLDWMRAP